MESTTTTDVLDELVYEYLSLKGYSSTLNAFASEAPSFARLRPPKKRSLNHEECLRAEIRRRVLDYFLSSDVFVSLVSPVRKIEAAVAELNYTLRLSNLSTEQKKLYNRSSWSSLGSKSSSATGGATIAPRRSSRVAAKTISANQNQAHSWTPSKQQLQPTPKTGNVRKTPDPKKRPLTSTAKREHDLSWTHNRSAKWDQVIEQHVTNTTMLDTVAEAINNTSSTGGDGGPDISEVIASIESNPELMGTFESMLIDYWNSDSNQAMEQHQQQQQQPMSNQVQAHQCQQQQQQQYDFSTFMPQEMSTTTTTTTYDDQYVVAPASVDMRMVTNQNYGFVNLDQCMASATSSSHNSQHNDVIMSQSVMNSNNYFAYLATCQQEQQPVIVDYTLQAPPRSTSPHQPSIVEKRTVAKRLFTTPAADEYDWSSGSRDVMMTTGSSNDVIASASRDVIKSATSINRIAAAVTPGGAEPSSTVAATANRKRFRPDTDVSSLVVTPERIEAVLNKIHRKSSKK